MSSQQKLGIDVLKEQIDKKIQAFYATSSAPFLINQRQFKLLTEIETGLEIIANSFIIPFIINLLMQALMYHNLIRSHPF